MAEIHGIDDPDEIEKMNSGKSNVKLRVPDCLRSTLRDVGLGELLAPVKLVTVSETVEVLVAGDAWKDIEFEVALDSGCTDNVCHQGDVPGYLIEASAGSRCGQGFLVGNGERVPNTGQAHLSLQTDGEVKNAIKTTLQIAKVSRPLMSVGRLCDVGLKVVFDESRARVLDKDGYEACAFERQPGGLYIARFRLKKPPPAEPFGRQGR